MSSCQQGAVPRARSGVLSGSSSRSGRQQLKAKRKPLRGQPPAAVPLLLLPLARLHSGWAVPWTGRHRRAGGSALRVSWAHAQGRGGPRGPRRGVLAEERCGWELLAWRAAPGAEVGRLGSAQPCCVPAVGPGSVASLARSRGWWAASPWWRPLQGRQDGGCRGFGVWLCCQPPSSSRGEPPRGALIRGQGGRRPRTGRLPTGSASHLVRG